MSELISFGRREANDIMMGPSFNEADIRKEVEEWKENNLEYRVLNEEIFKSDDWCALHTYITEIAIRVEYERIERP